MTAAADEVPRRLVWLASYPKSGNTWLRALVAAYLFGRQPGSDASSGDDALGLAGLGAHFSSRAVFDAALGVPSAYLTSGEVDQFRPAVWRWINQHAARLRFVKTHDQWRRTAEGHAIFPADATTATVVIVRNPLAIAPSWAHHSGIDIGTAVDSLNAEGAGLSQSLSRVSDQLPQIMGTWSAHVSSWLDQTELPVTFVRYEDLSARPADELTRVLRAIGLAPEQERVESAVATCAFDRLAAREQQSGFAEQAAWQRPFFRRGEVDSWRWELTAAQIARIVGDHGTTMERLGYATSLP